LLYRKTGGKNGTMRRRKCRRAGSTKGGKKITLPGTAYCPRKKTTAVSTGLKKRKKEKN